MIAVDFEESNTTFTAQECLPLKAHADVNTGRIVSCWEASPDELEMIQRTGKIWLTYYGGVPPTQMSALSPFFVPATDDEFPDEIEEPETR